MKTWKTGDKIKNGAEILAIRKTVGVPWHIVLCFWKKEFVTWTLDPVTGAVYSGHYYKTIEAAIKDFGKRN